MRSWIILFALVGLVPAAAPSQAQQAVPARVQSWFDSGKDLSPAVAKKLVDSAPTAEQYPNAAKITLLDLSDIAIHADGTATNKTRQLVRIFNERGREEGEVRLSYTEGQETIKLLYARTIRPDGTVVKLDLAEVSDKPLDTGDGSYHDARTVSFSLPAIENGCIVDYQYVTEQTKSHLPGHFFYAWQFQGGIDPVVLSRITVTTDKGVALRNDLRPAKIAVKNDVRDTPSGGKTYTWEASDVPPLETEPMSDFNLVHPTLDISTLADWQTVAAWYARLAEGRTIVTPEIKQSVNVLIQGKKTPEEKAKAIFYDVESRTRYVAKELGIGAYQPRPAADTFANRSGDCKDMATLLVAMLRQAGIEAYPVLLRVGSGRRSIGTSEQLPSPGAFNHAICLAEINGKKYWLDATAENCAWGQIPGGDRGAEAFVVRDGKGSFELIPYAAPSDSRITQNATLELAPDGTATGTVIISGSGDVDMSLRSAFAYLPPDRQKGFVESLLARVGPNARVVDWKVSDFRDRDAPVKVACVATFPNWAKRSGDLLLFKARVEQTGGDASSPFREETRRYPIVQSDASRSEGALTITLPAGATILSLPESGEARSEMGKYVRDADYTGGKLTLKTVGENYRTEIPANKYAQIRQYFLDYLTASEELVVLKQPRAPKNGGWFAKKIVKE